MLRVTSKQVDITNPPADKQTGKQSIEQTRGNIFFFKSLFFFFIFRPVSSFFSHSFAPRVLSPDRDPSPLGYFLLVVSETR